MSAEDDFKPAEYESKDGGVVADDAPIDGGIDASKADSDEQLEADDKDAIDKSNIISGRTRGAGPDKGGYREPGDEEGIPADE